MSKPQNAFSRRDLAGLLAGVALAIVGAIGVHAVATDSEAGQLLASELPAGTSLSTATNEQVIVATRRAVRKKPELAVGVVRVAILSKTPARRRPQPMPARATTADFKDTPDFKDYKDYKDRTKEDPCPCDLVVGVARAAILEAPDQAGAIIEEASALCPSCAPDLQNLLNDPALGIGAGPGIAFAGPFGFGLGLGPNFPGGPGTLTPPDPAVVLPGPPPSPVTPVVPQ